jgi:carotenoid cleavage dioxygenase-like enzyme
MGVELFCTAHPHSIPGDTYSYNYYLELKPLGTNLAHIVRTDQKFHRTVVATVDVGKNVPYVHDFSLTEKHAILAIWPISSDLSTTTNGAGTLYTIHYTLITTH